MENIKNMSKSKVKMFFLPAVIGISHITPLVNAARLFGSHPDVQVTIITTQSNAQIFQNAIDSDREKGHDIGFYIVKLPLAEVGLPEENVDQILSSTSPSLENMAKLVKAVRMLSGPVLDTVRAQKADCLVSDLMNPWAANVASEVGIPLIVFTPAGLFGVCVDDSLNRYKPHENVDSDTELFVVPGLPDKVEFTRSRLPDSFRGRDMGKDFKLSVQNAIDASHCMIVNSYDEIEFKYAEYCKNVKGMKCCLVGPVQCGLGTKSNIRDKENSYVLEWLDCKPANSVLYVSFGSYAPICKEQFYEIAHGLEGSGHSFIWVAKTNVSGDLGEDGWFPEGFEERVKDSKQGLIIKTWAPQELILAHPSVGAFMTHCGWNSCLETLSYGVPVVTWPLRVEQFYHESLLVDVLKIGFRVGNEEWTSQQGELKVTVLRSKVKAAVTRMMDSDEEEVKTVRKRAQEYVDKSKAALLKGGSSYRNVYALVEEIKTRHKESNTSA